MDTDPLVQAGPYGDVALFADPDYAGVWSSSAYHPAGVGDYPWRSTSARSDADAYLRAQELVEGTASASF